MSIAQIRGLLNESWNYLGTDADGNEWYKNESEGWVNMYNPKTDEMTEVE